jgi:hypothetical protein
MGRFKKSLCLHNVKYPPLWAGSQAAQGRKALINQMFRQNIGFCEVGRMPGFEAGGMADMIMQQKSQDHNVK